MGLNVTPDAKDSHLALNAEQSPEELANAPRRKPGPRKKKARKSTFETHQREVAEESGFDVRDAVDGTVRSPVGELRSDQCRWVLKDIDRWGNGEFCAEKREGDGPYCKEHEAIARQQYVPRRRRSRRRS